MAGAGDKSLILFGFSGVVFWLRRAWILGEGWPLNALCAALRAALIFSRAARGTDRVPWYPWVGGAFAIRKRQ